MKPINGWENVEAQGNDEYKRLVPGGYVCRITKVEDNPEKEYLYIEFDIAEGEYKRHGTQCLERNGFTPLRMWRSYSQKAAGMFKGFVQCMEQSNQNTFKWAWKEQELVGKFFGAVLGEEEYKKQDGNVGTRLNVVRTKTPADIRAGDFKIPEKKLLKQEQAASSGFTAMNDDDGELPF